MKLEDLHEVKVDTRNPEAVTVDGFVLRRVTDVQVQHGAGKLPVVTVSFVAARVDGTFDPELEEEA